MGVSFFIIIIYFIFIFNFAVHEFGGGFELCCNYLVCRLMGFPSISIHGW